MAERDALGRLKAGHEGLKPKGAVSKKTEMWEALGEYIVSEGAQKAMRIIDEMPDEDFLDNYIMLLEFFKPKQARTAHVGEPESPVQIVIPKDL